MKMSRDRKIERFEQKYRGKGGFEKFKSMVENLSTLEEIGQYFGFSRQNTAGLFRSFFSKGYNILQQKRQLRRKIEQLKNCCDLVELEQKLYNKGKIRSSKKVAYIRQIKDLSEKMGYDVRIRRKRSGALDVFINGHFCAISGTDTQTIYHIPKNHPPSVYYRFAVPSKSVDYCVFILDVENNQTFYLIPHDRIHHLSLITLKTSYEREKGRRGNTSSKYAIYRNRWDLLAKPNPKPQYEILSSTLKQTTIKLD